MNHQERGRSALEHVNDMQRRYTHEIEACVRASQIVSMPSSDPNKDKRFDRYAETNISLAPLDSVSAILEQDEQDHCAVLNFASFTHPGGGYISGAMAQEEALCTESFLYNILSDEKFETYYKENAQRKNHGLYAHRGIYSPDVIFERGDSVRKCDVITMAAPNKSGMPISALCVNDTVLKDRIDFILSLAVQYRVDTLILGAYGCGVFGQEPALVAKIFLQAIPHRFKGAFKSVCFAIPSGGRNYDEFEKAMAARTSQK